MTRPEWTADLDLALEAAWAAGRVTLRWFQAGPGADPDVELKADRSPVTVADREAERVMREMLRARRPGDGILGEEAGEEAGEEPGPGADRESEGRPAGEPSETVAPGHSRRWILDPIDGTRSFIHGVPLYGVMVALEADGEPVVGVLHFPALGETVAAARGLGCRWNGRPARVSDVDRLEDALVLTSGDARPDGRIAAPAAEGPGAGAATRAHAAGAPADPALAGRVADLQRLAARAHTFRTWGDCYGYALVATGRAEAMLDPVLNVWDAAAVRPIIEEAGGRFGDWSGAPDHEAGHVIATNARIAEAVRAVIEERE